MPQKRCSTRAWSHTTTSRPNATVVPSRTYGARGLPVAVVTDSCAGSPRAQRVAGNDAAPEDVAHPVVAAQRFASWRPPSWLRLRAGGRMGVLADFGGVPEWWWAAKKRRRGGGKSLSP